MWSICDREERIWKYIEKYELRNVLDVSIVAPVKRVFKNASSNKSAINND